MQRLLIGFMMLCFRLGSRCRDAAKWARHHNYDIIDVTLVTCVVVYTLKLIFT